VGRIQVRVQPRARKDEVASERNGRLVVRITAPPVDGKANAALRKLLAKRLGVPASAVTVVRGEASRDKLVEVEGLDDAVLRRTLGSA
jgi:uncharacterized protein (TIGR00251 family)